MITNIRSLRYVPIASLLMLGACELDIANPNAPTEDEVLTTAEGLKALAIGMQGRFGNAIEETVFISGVVSGELGNTNATPSLTREFQDFPDPAANSDIEDTNSELDDLWTKHYGVVKSADDIIQNVGNVQLDPGTQSGMVALAKVLKAMAFTALIENFEQIPVEASASDAPVFVDRAAALQTSLTLLAEAQAELAATPPSVEFTDNILATGFDLDATISAMQARVSLLNGDHQNAIDFANAVSAGATSVLAYDPLDPNPIKILFVDLGYFGAIESFRASAEPGDTRIDQLTTSDVIVGFGGATLNGLNIYQDDADPFSVFTDDELVLIRAEANARLDNLPEAVTDINIVRVAAGLTPLNPATLTSQAVVLDAVFIQRTFSLFTMGLHWGDLRRFGFMGQSKVDWLPYPFNERVTNSNTPENP